MNSPPRPVSTRNELLPITRKDLFRLGLARAADFFASVLGEYGNQMNRVERILEERFPAPGRPDPLIRPPGALSEEAFLARCTRCDACVRACPPMVIRKAGPELSARIQGTPILIPMENACTMCPDLPCIESCPEGALVRPPAGETPSIGTAVIDPALCYLARAQPCDYCVKACPVAPRAIEALTRGEAPRVDAAACTGCGRCAVICPTAAIQIEDIRDHPTRRPPILASLATAGNEPC